MPSSLNGTGVTFNDGTTLQSGNIPAANLGSGTANASTVLRGNRTFGAPPAPTTAQVLSATAGAAVGAVGTYAFLGITDGTPRLGDIVPGGTVAGSRVRFAGFRGSNPEFNPVFFGINVKKDLNISNSISAGVGVSGTWRCMGVAFNDTNTPNNCGYSSWLRIS